MPVNLSIKNVPDDLAERLRKQAAGNHRSLQGELMVILEQSVAEKAALTPQEVLNEVLNLALSSEAQATEMIREDRDKR